MAKSNKVNRDPISIKKDRYSVVIPAYNEEDRIQNVLEDIVPKFKDHEIIVVFDGSDRTPDIVKTMTAKNSHLKLIQSSKRLGKGGALIEGFKAAQGDKIGFVDADESVNAEEVRRLFDALREEDGIIGSRRLHNSKILIKQPFPRRVISKV